MFGVNKATVSQGGLPPFVFGNCIAFNGGRGEVEGFPTANDPVLAGDFGISCWIYPEDIGNLKVFIGLAASASDRITIDTPSAISVRAAGSTAIFAVPTLQNNQWYHVLITRLGTNLRLYLNAVESTTGPLTFTETIAPSVYGAREGGSLQFVGKMDEIYIWDKAVTAAQCSLLYNNGDGNLASAVVSAPIQANPLNVTTGSYAPDTTGNSRGLNMIGAYSWVPHS